MKVISKPRQMGKTKELLDWMDEAPEGTTRVMICHSNESAMATLRRSRNEGRDLESWQFIGPGEARNYRPFPIQYGLTNVEICIDNVDLILQSMVPRYPIECATVTDNEAM